MWAFEFTFYIVLTRQCQFPMAQQEHHNAVKRREYEMLRLKEEGASSDFVDLIDHLVDPNPRSRDRVTKKSLISCLSFSQLRIINIRITSSKLNQFLNQSHMFSKKICS
jgi:hypothetical protein